jgi:hypothetical protein
MNESVVAKKKNNQLIIRIGLDKPRPSKSGKSNLLATTRGPKRTALVFDGKPVYVVVNAFTYK